MLLVASRGFRVVPMKGVTSRPLSVSSPDDLSSSFNALSVKNTRSRLRTPKAKPVSARKGGLDGDAWERTVAADATPEIIEISDDDWIVDDNSDSAIEIACDDGGAIEIASDDEAPIEISSDDEAVRDLTKPTPLHAARDFAERREYELRQAFVRLNEVVADDRLSCVECSWSNRLRTTAGRTIMSRRRDSDSIRRIAKIEMSTHVIDNDDKMTSTLAHELCHAAAWVIDGVLKPPHGPAFRKWAMIVQDRIPSITVSTTHRYFIAYGYRWRCSDLANCTYTIGRHSNSVDTRIHCCPRCAAPLIVDDRRIDDLPTGTFSSRRPRRRGLK